MSDDDTNDDHGFAAIPLPGALLESLLGDRDRHRMAHQTIENEVFHLLDSLNAAQLLTLRRVLNGDSASASNNYIDGQIVSLLRIVHKVDHVSGESYEGALLDLADTGRAPGDHDGKPSL